MSKKHNRYEKKNHFPLRLVSFDIVNPLSANSTKWSNTLKQFVGNSQQIV